jgi:uncharacterized protein (TIGR02996 family)
MNTHDERAACLAALRTTPGAEESMLRYAQLLEDSGEVALAEFLRLECSASAA